MEEEEGVNTILLMGWRRRKGLIEQNEHMLTSTPGYTVQSQLHVGGRRNQNGILPQGR